MVSIHFHIRWTDSEKLDWERFNSREDAEVSAEQLMRPGESYEIEEFDDSCAECKPLARFAHKAS
jgi:hypothetical protein